MPIVTLFRVLRVSAADFRGVSVNVQDLAPSCAGALYGQPRFISRHRADGNSLFLRFNLVFLSFSTGFMNTVGALMGKFLPD